MLNKLSLNMQFKLPTQNYMAQFLLKNTEHTDVRIYKVHLNVIPKPMSSKIEFKTPKGEKVVQNIPLVN